MKTLVVCALVLCCIFVAVSAGPCNHGSLAQCQNTHQVSGTCDEVRALRDCFYGINCCAGEGIAAYTDSKLKSLWSESMCTELNGTLPECGGASSMRASLALALLFAAGALFLLL